MDREEKLNQLKNSLAWMCCDELLVPPIPLVEPLRLLNSDTDEIKQEKRNKHTRLIFERDQERKEREPELLSSLDKVVERVVVARPQYKKTIDYATITDQTKTVKLSCPNCKNKEPDDFFPDPKSGDTVCLKCGLVVHALGIDKGAAKRNFEGEEEKNHFGPAPNALMSDAYNMSTRMTVTKNGMNNSNYQKTARVAQQVEMDLRYTYKYINISTFNY